MAQNLQKSMVLDGIAASEAIDSSGEILDIKGLDITSLQDGTGVLNYEHRGDQSEGASANDVIGAITFAKKIFGPEDCDDERQKEYWNKVQLPFVYIQAELFDGEDHPGAKAAASLIRYYHRRKLPILMRYSIEGSTLERDGQTLKRAVARRVAATIKPCNRSCVSGVLSDDKDLGGATKDVLEDLVRHEDPTKKKIGGYEGAFEPIIMDPMEKMRDAVESLHEINDLNKALAAGGFDAAPTTLTQGSALQAEFIDGEKRKRFIKNQAMAALRDWRGRGDLRKFLKHRMPDTSSDFIEHFANLVEDVQLKKMIALEDDLVKAVTGKKVGGDVTAPPPSAPASKPAPFGPTKAATMPTVGAKVKPVADEDEIVDIGDEPLTIRGRKIRPINTITSPHFDERKGVLYTQRGSFRLYLPQNDTFPGALESFHNVLNDPKTTKFHDYAVSNWLKVHKMAKEGTLPPEIVMHSTLFSQLSPNTPVPMQELMYAHLVDTMNDAGVDARSPEFAQLKDNWAGRDQPANYPQTGGEYFREGVGAAGVHLKKPSYQKRYFNSRQFEYVRDNDGNKIKIRDEGQLSAFMLANNKFKNMAQYHTLHQQLVDLFGHHRHDARAAVAELMNHKYQAQLWEARRKRELDKGRPDIGDYNGPVVPGLAPKTGRYMAAMAGGGNVHVPDTHFSRFLFGLEKGTDSRSIDYLKQLLWSENNSHILDSIDRFYAKHHPAVQHMMDHPVFGKQFATREDAVFPAFWKNWIAIAPHERARKMKTTAFNEATDHRPFWEAVQSFIKNEPTSLTLPMQTARLHAQWVQQHGEIPAQMLYYAHIVPQLLRAGRNTETAIVKMERLAQRLRKTAEDMQALPQLPQVDTTGLHQFKDKYVKPGEIEITFGPYKGSKLHFLGSDDTGLYVKPQDDASAPVHKMDPIHKGKLFRINSDPQAAKLPEYIDANVHADPAFVKTHPQKLLAHGIDLANREAVADQGLSRKFPLTGWYSSAAQKKGYVKEDWPLTWDNHVGPHWGPHQRAYSLAKREVLFHNMARDFFGLGAHVPNTALFKHPKKDLMLSVMERIPNAFHSEPWNSHLPRRKAVYNALGDENVDKLGLMDLIMANSDRHNGNYMLSDEAPHLHLIDNGLILNYHMGGTYRPEFWYDHGASTASADQTRDLHPNAVNWLLGLDHKKFHEHLIAHGVPPVLAEAGQHRLLGMQLHVVEREAKNRERIARGEEPHTLNRSAIYEEVKQLARDFEYKKGFHSDD